ncbi:hypothetical protein NDU88_000065 [Pleurodeles waltl]|uniref:Uncharacterized protein n=1 Tax=Pleurodeles waltl TaxID=8319 RepID=A0AAV7L8L4_PLEWA|nr:hypothetical protein NDU88_000065 [Pleurodeles waltl]
MLRTLSVAWLLPKEEQVPWNGPGTGPGAIVGSSRYPGAGLASVRALRHCQDSRYPGAGLALVRALRHCQDSRYPGAGLALVRALRHCREQEVPWSRSSLGPGPASLSGAGGTLEPGWSWSGPCVIVGSRRYPGAGLVLVRALRHCREQEVPWSRAGPAPLAGAAETLEPGHFLARLRCLCASPSYSPACGLRERSCHAGPLSWVFVCAERRSSTPGSSSQSLMAKYKRIVRPGYDPRRCDAGPRKKKTENLQR